VSLATLLLTTPKLGNQHTNGCEVLEEIMSQRFTGALQCYNLESEHDVTMMSSREWTEAPVFSILLWSKWLLDSLPGFCVVW
jgi:hypothetical protein